MANDSHAEGLTERQQRRAEHQADENERKGLDPDHARAQAEHEVNRDKLTGGHADNGGHDKPKHANHQGDHRTGTQSDAHK